MNEIINANEIRKLIFDSDDSANEISRKSGVALSTISELRRGMRKVDNLTLKILWKLQQYINENKNEK